MTRLAQDFFGPGLIDTRRVSPNGTKRLHGVPNASCRDEEDARDVVPHARGIKRGAGDLDRGARDLDLRIRLNKIE